ncbi:MAG: DNA methyltransferase [Desulfomonilaceae bacterium]
MNRDIDPHVQAKPDVELVWRGKAFQENRQIVNFHFVERFKVPCDSSLETQSCCPSIHHKAWHNKLVHGDNKTVMSSLLAGEMRAEIESVGGIKLVYIDPPFLGGVDHNISIPIGDGKTDQVKIIQELAYKDSWKSGPGEYLNVMYERLWLIKKLLSDDGSIWVHCDWKANFMLRAILNEIFGPDSFRNEIIWYYTNKIPDTRKRQYTNSTDTILYYCKSAKSIFNWQFEKREKPIKVSRMQKVRGKKVYPKGPDGKCIYDTRYERTADNVWKFPLLHSHPEMWGYPTQKPVALLKRIILTATNEGDLVADPFCGSGATLEAAQRLGRKWIGCDVSRVAIHTCRKRLIKTLNEEKEAGKILTGFDILEASASDIPVFERDPEANLENAVFNAPSCFKDRASNFKVKIEQCGFNVRIKLTDFRFASSIMMKKHFNSVRGLKSSRVELENGQLYKVVKRKPGIEERSLLTQTWADWIDLWAVDFEYGAYNLQPDQNTNNIYDSSLFCSSWQSFRTPRKRSIDLTSSRWTYRCPGRYLIGIKLVDIFCIETFQLFEIDIP